MAFRLIDRNWQSEFELAAKDCHELMVIAPFIYRNAAMAIASGKRSIRIITRFDLNNFYDLVSDLVGLRELIDMGAQIRGIQHLHSKAYVFDDKRAIVTSANLTDAGLNRNHELGFVSEDKAVVAECRKYFDSLWKQAGNSLTLEKTNKWLTEIAKLRKAKKPWIARRSRLRDEGVDIGLPADPAPLLSVVTPAVAQSFVKFQGTASHRVSATYRVIDEISESETNWACNYPSGKRPRQVQDGDIMFVARLVKNPQDTIIYGRAVARAHRDRLDDASADDIRRCPWKKTWPHHVRLQEPAFVGGTLSNGVSLNRLMESLKWDAFEPTRRNREKDSGNQNPRRSILQKPAIQLSETGANWLNDRFNEALATHGQIPASKLAALYSPHA